MFVMKKCPKCGSKKVAPILYGMPAFDEELKQQLNNEQIYLGGCFITGYAPQYHCFACGKNVGTPPILFSKRGEEDYRDIVTFIRFSDGGYFYGWDELMIKKTPAGFIADINPRFQRQYTADQRILSEKEWNKLVNRLFCKLYVHEWKKQYNDWTVLDGEQWELEIRLTDKRVRNYCGSNAYPAYWKELKRTFEPFFKSTDKLGI